MTFGQSMREEALALDGPMFARRCSGRYKVAVEGTIVSMF